MYACVHLEHDFIKTSRIRRGWRLILFYPATVVRVQEGTNNTGGKGTWQQEVERKGSQEMLKGYVHLKRQNKQAEKYNILRDLFFLPE